MKKVYILTPDEMETLRFIQSKISSDTDIIDDIAIDSKYYPSIRKVLDRIDCWCNEMEDILAGTWNGDD